MSRPVGVAVIGAGVISRQYLTNLVTFPDIAVHAVADLDTARAAEAAAEFGVPKSGTVAEALALPEVELVLNLTIPAAHVEVDLAAIAAGKHVYSEKPLALDKRGVAEVQAAADKAGLRVGCAPDTFLGAGIQTAVRAVREGLIGTPVAAAARFETVGPEGWHPSPEFLFLPGAGPLFDMGPYYLTALAAALGPVARVGAVARTGRSERVIGSGPKAGTVFPVETPTHVNALLEFASGPSGSATFSFDGGGGTDGGNYRLEVVGTEGTLALPDPNTFDGPLRLRRNGETEWTELPVQGTSVGRGIGLLDLARQLRADRPHRASGALAGHVVAVMEEILASAADGAFHALDPVELALDPLPQDWEPTAATL